MGQHRGSYRSDLQIVERSHRERDELTHGMDLMKPLPARPPPVRRARREHSGIGREARAEGTHEEQRRTEALVDEM